MTLDPTAEVPLQPSFARVLRERLSLTAGSLVCAALAMWLGRVLHVPAEQGFAGAILQQPSWPLAMALMWVVMIGGSVLGSMFTLGMHEEAGVFCAAFGLAGMSVLFGPSKYVLFATTGPAVYLMLAAELVTLSIPVQIALLMRRRLSRSIDDESAPLDQDLLAAIFQAMVTALLIMLLCQSDNKPQTMISVGLAAYVAGLATHSFFPTTDCAWLCIGMVLAGVFGYCIHYFNPSDWMIGDVRGVFAGLVRPLPLDYVSFGTAGTLLGFWTSRSWQREEIE